MTVVVIMMLAGIAGCSVLESADPAPPMYHGTDRDTSNTFNNSTSRNIATAIIQGLFG